MTKARTLADNFAADINGITAGTGITGGGTSGTVTVTNSMATAIDAKGDLVVGTGADTFSRLAVGANDTVLVAASGEATGLKWAAPAAGGSLVYITSASFSGSSAVNVNDCFSATYENYMIRIENTTLASGSDIRLQGRLRVSGADNTTSNYNESRLGMAWYSGTSSIFNARTAAGNSWFFWGNFETSGGSQVDGPVNATIFVYQPYATKHTSYTASCANSDASQHAGGKFGATTSFTGFSIFPGSSTISGTVKVYGIKDS